MPKAGPHKLREFYHQALLTPEMLCLNCAHANWEGGSTPCSESKRRDCLLFANQVALELDARCRRRGHHEAPRVDASP